MNMGNIHMLVFVNRHIVMHSHIGKSQIAALKVMMRKDKKQKGAKVSERAVDEMYASVFIKHNVCQ